MIFLYFFWSFFLYILNFFHIFIENNFLINNNPFFLRKRTFKFISYFEKIFLVLFYKKGWFEKSLANLYRKKDILDYRRINYPIIHSFHLINNEFEYDNLNLKLFVKQYNFYKKCKSYFNFFLKIFRNNNKNLIKFSVLFFIFNKKYFCLNSYNYYYNNSELNLLKLNKLFLFFLLKSKKKFIFYDLNKWDDWYNYNFHNKIIHNISLDKKINRYSKKRQSHIKLLFFFRFQKLILTYKKNINNFNKFFGKKNIFFFFYRFNFNNFFKIKLNKDYFYLLKFYIIKFSESSITKNLNSKSLYKYNFLYLRKNRIFNKGRYSRNRQLYRTGVYWCLWLNIIMVYGLYFIFYRFSFNFGYFWWGILVIAYSTIFSRIVKYNFFNLIYLYKEFFSLIFWYGFIIENLYSYFINFFLLYLKNLNTINIFYKYKKNFLYLENIYLYVFKFIKKYILDKRTFKNFYMWRNMSVEDTSFFKVKTIIHWLKEIWRLIITK